MNTTATRLENALIQLHKRLAGKNENVEQSESRFTEWEQRWNDRHGRIARGLELIDAQLTSFDRVETDGPHLTLYNDAQRVPV